MRNTLIPEAFWKGDPHGGFVFAAVCTLGQSDNLVIGLAYGMRGIRIRLEAGVLISGMVLAGLEFP